jgi:formate dehydrogenase subunit delta
MDVEKLVRMANQIAANFDYGSDKEKVAAAVADHLKRFWTPEMCALVIEGHKKNLIDLSPIAARAVEKLAPPKTSAA